MLSPLIRGPTRLTPSLHRAPTTCPRLLPPRRSRERPHPLRLLRRGHTAFRRPLPRRLSRERMRHPRCARGPLPCPSFRFRLTFLANARTHSGCSEGAIRRSAVGCSCARPANACNIRDCSRGAVPCAPFRFRHALLANACAVPRCSAGAIQRAAIGCGRAKPGFRAIRRAGAGIALRHSVCRRRCAGHEPAPTARARVWGRRSVCGPRHVYSISGRAFRPSVLRYSWYQYRRVGWHGRSARSWSRRSRRR